MAVCRGVEPLLPDRQSGVIAVIPTDHGARDRTRTCTALPRHGILSPMCLPIPPHEQEKMVPPVGLEPTRLST